MQQTQLGQKPRYYWLDVARVIAVLSITLNHAVNRAYDNYGNQMAEFLSISSASTLVKTVVTVFSRMGVPLFLMISGVLLLGKTMETGRDVRKFYRHNLLGLLITSEIWYFLMYWFLVLLKPGNTMLSELGVGGAIWGSVKNAFFFDQVTLGSMWYIPMILCLYVMIPFMAAALQKIPRKYLLLPMGLVFIGGMVVPNVNAWISLSGSEKKFPLR